MNRTRYLAPILVGVLLTAWAVGGAQSQKPGPPEIVVRRGTTERPSGAIEVSGLKATDLKKIKEAKLDPDAWKALFAMYVSPKGAEEKPADRPPVLGSYEIDDVVIRFIPRFPLAPAVSYHVRFDPKALPAAAKVEFARLDHRFEIPRPVTAPATVVQVYPTRNVLPENQLKFYIHFSAPMSQGESYQHVQLLNAEGKAVERPFLELGEELWDYEGKRFTLFFDPGRIKRGLKPREEFGPAIEEGKSYTLVIDRRWTDANGNPLKESYRKAFRVVAPDDTPIEPKEWKIRPPAAGSSDPLTVELGESLDHALLHRLLWVTDPAGKPIDGDSKVTGEETRWQLMGTGPWKAGTYHLVIDTVLEDLAGNKVGKPFEVDVFHSVQRKIETKIVRLPFEVK